MTATFDDICYERKKQVIHELFSGEMRALGKQLGARGDARPQRARFRAGRSDRGADRGHGVHARVPDVHPRGETSTTTMRSRSAPRSPMRGAARATTIDERLFTFLERVLLVDPPAYVASEREHWLAFVMRWQQFTGRVMAKGVEDTAFYNYNRLISLNEVGGDPGRDGDFDGLAEFHARNAQMQQRVAAHDERDVDARHEAQRGRARADQRAVRNRAAVGAAGAPLVEDERAASRERHPRREHGAAHLPDAHRHVAARRRGPAVGARSPEAIPRESGARSEDAHELDRAERRRTKKRSSPSPTRSSATTTFCEDFVRFQKRVAFYGFLNALSQVVLKATAPGAPDFYQGTELWDFSLVDPDNRRPVDYADAAARC